MKIIHKTKRATVEVDRFQDTLEKMFLGFLKTVAPNAQAIMDQELKENRKESLSWTGLEGQPSHQKG
jgi:hypothetical protein